MAESGARYSVVNSGDAMSVSVVGEIDHHSHVHNARICTDGPVFEAQTVEI